MLQQTFKPYLDGSFSVFLGEKAVIFRQPLVTVISGGKLYYPYAAEISSCEIKLTFECGQAVLSINDKIFYTRLEVTSISDNIQHVIFGCYHTPLMEYGELIGAAHDGKNAVCIQSLNPKTVGCFPPKYFWSLYPNARNNRITPNHREQAPACASIPVANGCDLVCHAENMTMTTHTDCMGAKNAECAPISGSDALIPGAAIAIIACEYSELLDSLGQLEILEHLPHPMKDGIWAKKNPRITESYMMIHDGTKENVEKNYEWVKKAGMKCLYSWGQFKSWGHFEMLPEVFGDDEGFKKSVEYAKSKGIESGFHTLSNFIQTNDPYVAGKPDDRLLVMDRTTLVSDIDSNSTALEVAEEKNFSFRTDLNCIRIGDELMLFTTLKKDEGKLILTGVTRGAYETKATPHTSGETVLRLFDHGYKTLFPNLELQNEMGKRVASLMKYVGVNRMSFDGLEGCLYTGRGEYACSKYTQDCYNIFGDSVMCDASMPSHYRWHIHSYFNWGEPYYDYPDRGGMPFYRAGNQEFFDRNFIPHMLGQYKISLAEDKFEATSLENFEHVLASTIAYNAGYGLDTYENVLLNHGLTDQLLNASRIWEDMRFNGEIPQDLRDEMKDEYADWHVEEVNDGWDVYQMHNQTFDLRFNNRGKDEFSSTMCVDRVTIPTTFKLKIRVGAKTETGILQRFALYGGWGGFNAVVEFNDLAIPGGHYLMFDGANKLEHYDENYHYIETITGKGITSPLKVHGNLAGWDAHWKASEGNTLNPVAVFRHPVKIAHIKRK